MRLKLLWEYVAVADSAHAEYGDPKSRVNEKDPVPIKHKSGFGKTPKRKKGDMSFLVGGKDDRNRFLKAMDTGKK